MQCIKGGKSTTSSTEELGHQHLWAVDGHCCFLEIGVKWREFRKNMIRWDVDVKNGWCMGKMDQVFFSELDLCLLNGAIVL